jgi:hypothetical protein
MTDLPERRPSPFRPNLEHQKKRAKELCRDLRAGKPEAVTRFRAHRPGATAARACLADAQFVIARELGGASWPALKAHADGLDRARRAIDEGAPAPDGDVRTLHIRCGSDIKTTLRDAGFVGQFLEYSNPYCQGPVPHAPDLPGIRARFILDAYGPALGLSEAGVIDKLRTEEEGLARAATDHQRVVLWFEHDSYDQLILARCLSHFAEAGAPAVLELVSINHFPGSERFIGLGQLPAEAIRMLWASRRAVDPRDLAVGHRVWTALRQPDPRDLAAAASGAAGLPDLPRAIRRHLAELPWTRDGLSLTERLTLGLIQAESSTIGGIFQRLTRELDPLPFLGDIMFLAIVEAMTRVTRPVFEVTDDTTGLDWPQRRLEITAAGRAVLAGEVDWLSLKPPERWVGGTRIEAASPHWRWDETGSFPVRA